MFICICRLVTRAQIEALAQSGARNIDQIGASSSAGTECGKCQRNIARILEAYFQRLEQTQTGSQPN
jgi:bacterioferritin-associated ferredoxin